MIFNVSKKGDWVQNFKRIFLEQNYEEIEKIFDVENFHLHNGLSLNDYCKYEFKEFKDKSENFGLTLNAEVSCYDLDKDYFYFSLGKKEDKALFETIFKWNKDTNKAIGNGYFGKIEPKMQFIKNGLSETKIRRINFKPVNDVDIKKIMLSNIPEEDYFEGVNLKEIMGGKFYSYSFSLLEDKNLSYWETVKLYTEKGLVKYDVLMRGEDHPLFIKDLYPTILSKNKFIIRESIHPVIIYVLKENGEEEYFKYPKEKHFFIDGSIKKVCLTDTLSFDWIVEL